MKGLNKIYYIYCNTMRERKIMKYFNIIVLMCLFSCAGETKFVQQDPQEGKSLLVGAILVENDGIEDVYEVKTAKITVIIVGKSGEGAKEESKGYRVKTDEKGYYILQNVPPGSYVIKGIEVDLGYETRLLLTSRWDGNTQIYYPIETMIDNTVRVWPEPTDKKIINMGVAYFKVDFAWRVIHERYNALENASLGIENKTYTMPNPVQYFKQKYPDWAWFE